MRSMALEDDVVGVAGSALRYVCSEPKTRTDWLPVDLEMDGQSEWISGLVFFSSFFFWLKIEERKKTTAHHRRLSPFLSIHQRDMAALVRRIADIFFCGQTLNVAALLRFFFFGEFLSLSTDFNFLTNPFPTLWWTEKERVGAKLLRLILVPFYISAKFDVIFSFNGLQVQGLGRVHLHWGA